MLGSTGLGVLRCPCDVSKDWWLRCIGICEIGNRLVAPGVVLGRLMRDGYFRVGGRLTKQWRRPLSEKQWKRQEYGVFLG